MAENFKYMCVYKHVNDKQMHCCRMAQLNRNGKLQITSELIKLEHYLGYPM